MMRIVLFALFLAALVAATYAYYPAEVEQFAGMALIAGRRAWDGIEANPVPVVVAFGTFVLTVAYYKAKGKSLRESVEAAATRVTVVAVPAPALATTDAEKAVVKRAKARATRTQLLADQIGLQNRHRKLPEAILKAEQESCYTEQSVADAGHVLANRRKVHDEAVAKLEALRKEKALHDAELADIEAELNKLAEMV